LYQFISSKSINCDILQSHCAWFVNNYEKEYAIMTLPELVRYIHRLEDDLHTYERKYGILSETFYTAYQAGEEPADDAWVLDWSDWAGAYALWLERKTQYQTLLESLYQQMPTMTVIEKAARREPFAVAG
jgi:hypothetical protein